MSQQKVVPPSPVIPPLNQSGLMTNEFMLWTQAVTRYIPIVGDGSPEGVIDAPQYSSYIDATGTTGSIKWIKMQPSVAGDTKQGWVLE